MWDLSPPKLPVSSHISRAEEESMRVELTNTIKYRTTYHLPNTSDITPFTLHTSRRRIKLEPGGNAQRLACRHSIHGDSRWFLALAELWNDLTHGKLMAAEEAVAFQFSSY